MRNPITPIAQHLIRQAVDIISSTYGAEPEALSAAINQIANPEDRAQVSQYINELQPIINTITRILQNNRETNGLHAVRETIRQIETSEYKTAVLDCLFRNHPHLFPNELGLGGLGLTELPASIRNLNQLTGLYLSNNSLQNIPPEIGNLGNLKNFYAWNNQIQLLPTEIQNLTNLTTLYVYANPINMPHQQIRALVDNLPHLVSFEIEGEQFRESIQEVARRRQALLDQELTLGNQELANRRQELSRQLNSINRALANPPRLLGNLPPLLANRRQELSRQLINIDLELNRRESQRSSGINSIIRILQDNRTNSEAKALRVRNAIIQIERPEDRTIVLDRLFRNYHHLFPNELDLSGLGLTELPASIGNLTQLTGLYLSNNSLQNIPPAIGNLGNLRRLNISNNPITSSPEEIGALVNNLNNLRFFYTTDNQFAGIVQQVENRRQALLDQVQNETQELENHFQVLSQQIQNASLELANRGHVALSQQIQNTNLESENDIQVLSQQIQNTSLELANRDQVALLEQALNNDQELTLSNQELENRRQELEIQLRNINGALANPPRLLGNPHQELENPRQELENPRQELEIQFRNIDLELNRRESQRLSGIDSIIRILQDNRTNSEAKAFRVRNAIIQIERPEDRTIVLDHLFRNHPHLFPNELNLYNCGLTELPASIDKLDNLVVLDIGRNNLKTLPPEIGNLSNLMRLNISYNRLRNLPTEIGNLGNLMRLNMSNNPITSSPEEIGALVNNSNLLFLYTNDSRFAGIVQQVENHRRELLGQALNTNPELANRDQVALLEQALNNEPELNRGDQELENHRQELEIQLHNINGALANPTRLLGNLPQLLRNYRQELERKLTNIDRELNERESERSSERSSSINSIVRMLQDDRMRNNPDAIAGAIMRIRRPEDRTIVLDYLFSNYHHLFPNELDLSGLGLTELPASIGNLTQLTGLYLSNNRLQNLPPEIGNLRNLQILDIFNNNLETLPPEIGNLSNLMRLNIFYNNLQNLPPEIEHLGNLVVLDIGRNNLRDFPPAIGNLRNLSTLHAFANNFETLPQEIEHLGSLEILDISSNGLRNLPTAIGNLRNLQTLNISNNRLRDFPTAIGNLRNLSTLHAFNNNLETLPQEIEHLGSLEILDIALNRLETLPTEIGNLGNLRRLNISNNPITSSPEEVGRLVRGLVNLEEFSISGNEFAGIVQEQQERRRQQQLQQNRLQLDGNQWRDRERASDDKLREILEIIYPNSDINGILSSIYSDSNPELQLSDEQKGDINEFAHRVLETTLYRDEARSRTDIVIPVLREVFDILQNPNHAKRVEYLIQITVSIGNCATPVADLIYQLYLGQILKSANDSPSEEEFTQILTQNMPIIERLVVRKAMLENPVISEELAQRRDAIEWFETTLNLLNTIEGSNNTSISSSRYGFNTPDVLKNEFVKMFCITQPNGGNAQPNRNDNPVIDNRKIQRFVDDFLDHSGIVSQRQRLLNQIATEVGNLLHGELYGHLSSDHYGDEDVAKELSKATDFSSLKDEVETALTQDYENIKTTYLGDLTKNLDKLLKKFPTPTNTQTQQQADNEAADTNTQTQQQAPNQAALLLSQEAGILSQPSPSCSGLQRRSRSQSESTEEEQEAKEQRGM